MKDLKCACRLTEAAKRDLIEPDERAKYAIRLGGIDAVSLTDNARNWYLQEPVLTS